MAPFDASYQLDHRYTRSEGRVYMTGTQALVRLPMLQRQRDRAAGLSTAGFISGYRGSPLGGFDKALWEAKDHLKQHDIVFQPGLNEDLAATAVWGSQQVNLYKDATVDGVFALWYGKGPGVDRSGDVLKHANNAGTSRHGGVLVLAGDDHACKSSTLPHQSEYAFMDAMIPVLNPAGVQEILDYGLIGWAMSRFSGCWIAMKTIAETVDSAGSVTLDRVHAPALVPQDFDMPHGGLNIRWPDKPVDQEYRLMRHKLYAVLAFARANRLDEVVIASPKPRFGIVTGKSYLDVRQALDDLGIDERLAADIGLTVYKVAMPWPLEREGIRRFAEGLEEILVVEEKRAVIENQLKEQLYNWNADVRPRVVGKFDEQREWILPSAHELSPARIAKVIARRLAPFYTSQRIEERVQVIEQKERDLAGITAALDRVPTFCSGCPHNTSTKVPEGSRALAGIGCHYMVTWMDRRTETFSQMGGEGVAWVGQAPFTAERHVFANLGDGTYSHSGLLAIRAAVAAKVAITYKILFNDAVAMTGGQPVDVPLTVPQLTHQLAAEGVGPIIIVTDEPEKYPLTSSFAPGVTIRHRDELEEVQCLLREQPDVSALIYDQTCATEKRRRRKRGQMVDPPVRVVVNESVCEGCGDCGVQSNCVSIVPVETEFGRKRQIDQSSCNKDLSCLRGFCPSFALVEGGRLKKPKPATSGTWAELPEPPLASLAEPYSILVTGVGGTGVVTIAQLLGMAAHLEGRGVSVLDMTGLAQKGGAVFSHVRIASAPDRLSAVRIAAGQAHLVLGTDFVTTGSSEALSKMRVGVTTVLLNTHEQMTSDFTRKPDLTFPAAALERAVRQAAGEAGVVSLDATGIATRLMGDAIATNCFLLGFAAQRGLLPVGIGALERAIELNGQAVGFNRQAFLWGRRAAADLAAVAAAAAPVVDRQPAHRRLSESLDEAIARRIQYLEAYQNAAWAGRYRDLVTAVRTAEARAHAGSERLTETVARNLFKVMSYKDEYEVARLYSDGSFERSVASQFEGDYRLAFSLAPPLLSEVDATTGRAKKRRFGPWMMTGFRLLARLKGLRGTAFDVFGRTEERRMERGLIDLYTADVERLIREMDRVELEAAIALAAIPASIRGFGPVKEANHRAAMAERAELLTKLTAIPASPGVAAPAAAE
ncbi:MAG: indolepyruvate ferredoxin oxidoreductase family protein [Alphaproteobacteria bacterium]|nr:indolepyruvate ferredoxin oxidoreductase family protein [Alphaproteobacteria bacterium]